MAIEKTLIIIKPEAFEKREDIKKYITSHSNLKIADSKILVLDDRDVESIYIDDFGTDLLDAAKEHLANKEVEACIIEGENAVEFVWNLVGKDFVGEKCDDYTIRYIFGRLGAVHYGDVTYYLNAVHKTTPSEVTSGLKWFNSK